MEKLKLTQRSKCIHDEKFVKETFEEIMCGGRSYYILVCVDIMVKAKLTTQLTSSKVFYWSFTF